MIIDKMENLRFYSPILHNLEHALEAIGALSSYEPDTYHFDGGYFMVQKGETKPMEDGDYEAHRKYVDVQILVEGSEEIAWMDVSDLTDEGYDETKDKQTCSGPVNHTFRIQAGMFWIAFPHDAHKAIRHIKDRQDYTKIVVKLPVFV